MDGGDKPPRPKKRDKPRALVHKYFLKIDLGGAYRRTG